MFFLPLPLDKTLRTIEDVENNITVGLPDPELYILISGKLSKNKVLWQSLVNVDQVKGESHARSIPISASEYGKSRLLNRDSRFRKESQYAFFLLWQKEMRELATGVYNLMKGTRRHSLPVGEFMDRLSASDEDVEANLSTVFRNMRGSKQYWYLRRSEVNCMVQEHGPPSIFITLSCAEYESVEIGSYLRKVNDVLDSFPIGTTSAGDQMHRRSNICVEEILAEIP